MTDEMLRRYSVLVDFLGKTLGPDYEVTLHDLDPQNDSSIIAIANGRVSGRTIGDSLGKKAQEMLAHKEFENHDYRLNYSSQLVGGKNIRSSTLFIKDDAGMPVGLLCINFDDSRFQALNESMLKLIHPANFTQEQFFSAEMISSTPEIRTVDSDDNEERFHNDVIGIMDALFNEAAKDITIPLNRMTQEERTQFISQLFERGIFRFKGAVQYCADRLGCSQASIYRYLSKAKNS